MISLWACFGSEVAGWLKLRKKEEKQAAFGYLVAQLVGGVGEPWLYGMSFRYPKLFVCSIVGSFVSGATALALGVTAYVLGLPSNVMVILTFMGGDAQNIINACIAAAAGFVVSFVATWFFGFTEDELENGPVADRS